jgi:hypothetical protein
MHAVSKARRFRAGFRTAILTTLLWCPTTLHADVLDGLVARYPLDGSAEDVAGTREGTISGSVLPVPDRFGTPAGAMSFDGVSAYIWADATGLPTAERTTMFWFYVNNEGDQDAPFGYGGGSCGTSWIMAMNQIDWPYPKSLTVSGHCNVNPLALDYNRPLAGDWHHWAVTTDVQGTRMFLDGILVAENSNFANNTDVAGKHMSIGVLPSSSGFAPYTDINVGYMNGRLDDVRVYDRALSRAEIIEAGGPDLPVPMSTPGTIALMAIGLGAISVICSRRRFARAA